MAERDQLARPLRRHDPRELRGRQGVALRQLAEPARRLRRHLHARPGDGPAPRQRLRADVHHPDRAGRVDVREAARFHRSGLYAVTRAEIRSRSASCAAIHAARSCSRTCARVASSRACRSSTGIVNAWWIASACPCTSNGFTVSAHSPSSSCAPAFSERMSTPSRPFTSGASFETRLSPSKTAFTSNASYCLYAATDCAKLSAICRSIGTHPLCWKRSLTVRASRCTAARYSEYSGTSCRDGSRRASIVT